MGKPFAPPSYVMSKKPRLVRVNFFFLIISTYNKNTYKQTKEKIKRYAWNHHHSVHGKVKAKEYYENNKERL